MSDTMPDMYAGLDQMIARSTPKKPATATNQPVQRQPAASDSKAPATASLKPDEPQPLRLYRKQTFYLGEPELAFLDSAQKTMRTQHQQEVYKNDLVRCALEFLAKDFEANKDKSFLARKFVRK